MEIIESSNGANKLLLEVTKTIKAIVTQRKKYTYLYKLLKFQLVYPLKMDTLYKEKK